MQAIKDIINDQVFITAWHSISNYDNDNCLEEDLAIETWDEMNYGIYGINGTYLRNDEEDEGEGDMLIKDIMNAIDQNIYNIGIKQINHMINKNQSIKYI